MVDKSKQEKKAAPEKGKGNLLKVLKEEDAKPKQPKRLYYIFYLSQVNKTFGDGRKSYYKLSLRDMPIEPILDP